MFVISLLQLCTFSPGVHADLVHQPAHAHHTATTEHCAPPKASRSTEPLTPHHQSTTEPVCCGLMGAQKGVSVFFLKFNTVAPLGC